MEKNSDQSLSPWDQNSGQTQLLKKVMQYNSNNKEQIYFMHQQRKYNLSVVNKPNTSYTRQSEDHKKLRQLHNIIQNKPLVKNKQQNVKLHKIGHHRLLTQIINREQSIQNCCQVGQNQIKRQLRMLIIDQSRKKQRQLAKKQQMVSLFSRFKSKREETFKSICKNSTQAFLNKNLIFRQHEKQKIIRSANFVLPKIQICTFTNKII